MANPWIKVKYNFSFGKLLSRLNKVLEDSDIDVASSLSESTKENIKRGVSPNLSNSTIEARQNGKTSFSGHSASSSQSTKPLYYTKKLYNSIKPVAEGVSMEEYGMEHEEGFTTPSKNIGYGSDKRVEARPFMAKEIQSKDVSKIETKIVNRINKAMK